MSDKLEYSNCEHEAARLLPWFVAETLSAADSLRVQTHVQNCPVCAADEQRERRLRAFVDSAPTVEHSPQPGLQALLTRIDELERELPPVPADRQPPPLAASRFPAIRWLAAAVVLQTIGLGILGKLLWDSSRLYAPRFSTLSAPTAESAMQFNKHASLRVVFAAATTVGEMQALLASIQATIVAGPSAAGVYTLALPDQTSSVNLALERLRADPAISFAEPQFPPGRHP